MPRRINRHSPGCGCCGEEEPPCDELLDLIAAMPCCDNRTFTFYDPNGNILDIQSASGVGEGECAITVEDVPICDWAVGSEWVVSHTPAFDAGLDPVDGVYVLTELFGSKFFNPSPAPSDTPKAAYVLYGTSGCICNSIPRVLDYSDAYGSCELTYNDSTNRWEGSYSFTTTICGPNCTFGINIERLVGSVTVNIELSKGSGTSWTVTKIFQVTSCNTCGAAGGSSTHISSVPRATGRIADAITIPCAGLPTVNVNGTYDTVVTDPGGGGFVVLNTSPPDVWGSFTLTGS